ncbi:hypothetical protein [Flagellimonas marina]|uniref:DUF3575 domain-containing protein n=1 Tax=Flagellimonas marina TaxID=1775168 RepID=A0ABV8PFQ9_9FLAO
MKKIRFILLLAPLWATAQLHMNIGVADVSQRMDGNTSAWSVGLSHFLENNIGISGNVRYTLLNTDNYYTGEFYVKYRFGERRHRFEIGPGMGYNVDDGDIHPIVHIRNSFRVGRDLWLTVDFDNAIRRGYLDGEATFTKARRETYFMFGLSMDIDYSIFEREPKRPKK